jgi:hypothetical protein
VVDRGLNTTANSLGSFISQVLTHFVFVNGVSIDFGTIKVVDNHIAQTRPCTVNRNTENLAGLDTWESEYYCNKFNNLYRCDEPEN